MNTYLSIHVHVAMYTYLSTHMYIFMKSCIYILILLCMHNDVIMYTFWRHELDFWTVAIRCNAIRSNYKQYLENNWYKCQHDNSRVSVFDIMGIVTHLSHQTLYTQYTFHEFSNFNHWAMMFELFSCGMGIPLSRVLLGTQLWSHILPKA